MKHLDRNKFLAKSLFMMIFCLTAIQSSAQVSVGNTGIRTIYSRGETAMAELKDAVTYFIVPDSFEQSEFDLLEKEISSIWKIGKIRFMRNARVKKKSFLRGRAAFIGLKGTGTMSEMGRTIDYECYFEYSFQGEGQSYPTSIARFALYPSSIELLKEAKRYSAIRGDDLTEVCSDNRRINNWSVGNLKNCIIFAQEKILAGKLFNGRKFVTKDKTEIAKLKKVGLSIPAYVLINNSPFSKGKKFNEEELFKDFDIPHTIKPNEQIDKEIRLAKEDYYYLSVVCNRKMVTYSIWNAKTNELVLNLTRTSFSNVKNSNLKKILKLLSK